MGVKFVIKCAYWLNAKPWSFLNRDKLPVICTIKKEHKNNPVKHIINFFPKVEEKVLEKLLIYWFLNFITCKSIYLM